MAQPEVVGAAWVEAENKVTFGYLDQIPARARIKERLTKLWNYERYGVPWKEGGRITRPHLISPLRGLRPCQSPSG